MWCGKPPHRVDWGSCYNAGPLELDPGCKLLLEADFEPWELSMEVSLPETHLDLSCAQSLDFSTRSLGLLTILLLEGGALE